MSTHILYIKQNDRRPNLVVKLKNTDNTPIDLTSAQSVTFTMKRQGAFAPKISNGDCTIINASEGLVSYEWQLGDTDTPTTYRGEFKITWATDIAQTLPEADYVKIIIGDNLL